MHAALAKSQSRKLYEFPAVTKVDGLPPASSLDGQIDDLRSVEIFVLEI